jgi:hypothetical protein
VCSKSVTSCNAASIEHDYFNHATALAFLA